MRARVLLATMLLAIGFRAQAADPIQLRLACWNMEGNGQAKESLLQKQLADKQGVDLWGLCEVRAERFDAYLNGAADGEGTTFEIIKGSTGGDRVRLAIIYDTSVLELVGEPTELFFVQLGSHGLRAPLTARFRGRTTGQEFIFAINHLKCCGDGKSKRRQQCKLIADWAEDQDVPVIIGGDFNIPINVDDVLAGEALDDPAFAELTTKGPFIWLEPEVLAKTQADKRFNSILDFILVANVPAEHWAYQARILHREKDAPITVDDFSDFEDTQSTTDHRPVDAILTLNAQDAAAPPAVAALVPTPAPSPAVSAESAGTGATAEATTAALQEILQRLTKMETEIQELRSRVDSQ